MTSGNFWSSWPTVNLNVAHVAHCSLCLVELSGKIKKKNKRKNMGSGWDNVTSYEINTIAQCLRKEPLRTLGQWWRLLGRDGPWKMATGCAQNNGRNHFCVFSWELSLSWRLLQFCVYLLIASQGRFPKWEGKLRRTKRKRRKNAGANASG